MRITVSRKTLFKFGLALLATALAVDASAQAKSKHHRATISPSIVYLQPGETAQFKAVLIATRLMAAQAPAEVKWGVNDIPGGNQTDGTIDSAGLYRAPASIPKPREVHICAEVPQAANRYLWATVIIGDTPPRYTQAHIWSEPVEEGKGVTAHLTDPHGIAIDKEGHILIADQLGSAVLRYSYQGEYLGRIDSGKGSEPGQVYEPRIVTCDQDGRIFVTDSKGDRPRVQVWNADGSFSHIFAEKGRPPGMILRAHGMDIDPLGRLFVSDVDNMRVNVYDRDGNFLYEWGEEGLNPGQFNAPHGLAVDKNSDVFVTGYYGPTQKFNSEGDFILAFCYGDPPDGPVYFHNMCGDKWGNIYVLVRTKGGYQGELLKGLKNERPLSVIKFNNNGDLVTAWSFTAEEHRETSACVDKQGRVYALFKGEHEMGVEIFQEE